MIETGEMPFPPSDRVIYQKNPLQEVICQLRFPTILQIGASAPASYQNRVRHLYPLYEKAEDQFPPELAGLLAQFPLPVELAGVVYNFRSDDNQQFISMASEFLAYTDRRYLRWEQFRESLQLAKDALEDEYHPAFYTRVGLRYRNVIDRRAIGLPSEPWAELLRGSLVGLLGEPIIGDRIKILKSETVFELEEVNGGTVRLQYGLANKGKENEAFFIDADLFTAERTNGPDAVAILDRFNGVMGNLFRWTITARLQDALEPQRVEGVARPN